MNDKYTPEQQAALDEAFGNLISAVVRGDCAGWDDATRAAYKAALQAYNELEDNINYELWLDATYGDDDPSAFETYFNEVR